MSHAYTKAQIDQMVSDLNQRITTANGTIDTVNTAISTHNTSTTAHSNLFSQKASAATVSELQSIVDDLILRFQENMNNNKYGFSGNLNYLIEGVAGESTFNIQLDLTSLSGYPITYELDSESGTLATGLTFNAETATITGTPTSSGDFVTLIHASNERDTTIIRIEQHIVSPEENEIEPIIEETVGEQNEDPHSLGFDRLSEIISDLRAGNTNNIVLGESITINWIKDGTNLLSITFDNKTYYHGRSVPKSDNGMYQWNMSDSNDKIWTKELALLEGYRVYNEEGEVIGRLSSKPSYMGSTTVMVTSIDTDVVSTGAYQHNARLEFKHSIIKANGSRLVMNDSSFPNDYNNYCSGSGWYPGSVTQRYLSPNSNSTDVSFLDRIPADIRSLVVPTTIKCKVTTYAGSIETQTIYLTNQKFFIPSITELFGDGLHQTATGSFSVTAQEGTICSYYSSESTSEENSKRIRYVDGYDSYCWWTRTHYFGGTNADMIQISADGSRIQAAYSSIYNQSKPYGICPAFVIA